MEKEAANNKQRRNWEAYVCRYGISVGLASGALFNPEMVEIINQDKADREASREDKDDKKPPKPPSRPNARIAAGRLALGNT